MLSIQAFISFEIFQSTQVQWKIINVKFLFSRRTKQTYLFLVDIQDCSITAKPLLSMSEQLILPDNLIREKDLSDAGAYLSGVDSIDSYQHILRQIAYISSSPVTYVDREFLLVCTGATEQVTTNELRVRVRQMKHVSFFHHR